MLIVWQSKKGHRQDLSQGKHCYSCSRTSGILERLSNISEYCAEVAKSRVDHDGRYRRIWAEIHEWSVTDRINDTMRYTANFRFLHTHASQQLFEVAEDAFSYLFLTKGMTDCKSLGPFKGVTQSLPFCPPISKGLPPNFFFRSVWSFSESLMTTIPFVTRKPINFRLYR